MNGSVDFQNEKVEHKNTYLLWLLFHELPTLYLGSQLCYTNGYATFIITSSLCLQYQLLKFCLCIKVRIPSNTDASAISDSVSCKCHTIDATRCYMLVEVLFPGIEKRNIEGILSLGSSL
jgi:hypothetical protein